MIIFLFIEYACGGTAAHTLGTNFGTNWEEETDAKMWFSQQRGLNMSGVIQVRVVAGSRFEVSGQRGARQV